MFIENLKPAKRELTAFINYLKPQTDLSAFIKLDFKMQLGYYIEFLANNGISISVTTNAYRFYYAKSKIVKKKTFKDVSLITIYQQAVIDGFSYLENPF